MGLGTFLKHSIFIDLISIQMFIWLFNISSSLEYSWSFHKRVFVLKVNIDPVVRLRLLLVLQALIYIQNEIMKLSYNQVQVLEESNMSVKTKVIT